MSGLIDRLLARLHSTRPATIAPFTAPAPVANAPIDPMPQVGATSAKSAEPELLTRPDGPCPIAHHVRQDCAILSDGTFYILAAKIIDHEVRDAAAVAELTCKDLLPNGKVKSPIPCDRKKLNELYGTAAIAAIPARTEIFQLYNDIIRRAATNRASEIQIGFHRGIGTVRMVIGNSLTKPLEEFRLMGDEGAHLFTIAFHQGDRGDSAENPDIDQERTIVDPKKLDGLGLSGIRMQFVKISGGRHLNIRPIYIRLPVSGKGLTPLQLTPRVEEELYEVMNYNSGVITVTGPTGAGKTVFSETYWTTANDTYDDTKFIVTINDPPESENPKLTNIEVRSGEVGGGFDRARKTLLRINPDFTGVGEARDLVSAKSALEIGRTSKKCMVTQHTDRALSAPKRYLDFGVPAADVFDHSLHLVWSGQRLLPFLCPHCSVPAIECGDNRRLRAMHRKLVRLLGDEANTYRARGKGCAHCAPDAPGKITLPGLTGHRKLFFELARPDEPMCDHLANNRKLEARRYWLEKSGMESMELQAFPYLQEGKIAFDTFVNAFSDTDILHFDLSLAGLLPTGAQDNDYRGAAE